MHRIIHGTLYARQPQPCGHTVRIHDLGHGHVEVTGSPRFIWEEVAPLSPLALADFEAARQSSLAGGELPVPERSPRPGQPARGPPVELEPAFGGWPKARV